MMVRDLIEKLLACPQEARVLFDTEAARFHVHLVSVDSCHYEDGGDPERPYPDAVILYSDDPREH